MTFVHPVTRHLDSEDSSTAQKPKVAVLLLHVGGPESLDGIPGFYRDLYSQPAILPPAKKESATAREQSIATFVAANTDEWKRQYNLVGARSPIADLAGAQALALDNLLNGRVLMAKRSGGTFRVIAAERFGRDSIASAVDEAEASGAEHLVAIPLYPCASKALAGICFAELDRALKGKRLESRQSRIQSFGAHPLYLRAVSDRIRRSIDLVPPTLRGETFLLFSVHSPPYETAQSDSYLDEIEKTAQALMRSVGFTEDRSAVAFQSFRAPCRHLEPPVRDFVLERAAAGVRAMVTVPLSYVTDSFETLFDLDIDAYKAGAENGVKQMRRVPSLNADPVFLRALSDLVVRTLPPPLAALSKLSGSPGSPGSSGNSASSS
jgi:ferrochelatase